MRQMNIGQGSAQFHSIIVTRPCGTVERYDPYYGSMDDMESCKSLASVRAELIRQLPSRREFIYAGE